MKKFLKKVLIFVIILLSTFTTITLINKSSVYAANDVRIDTTTPCPDFLGLTSWDCNVVAPQSESELSANIWIIAANVLKDISVIAAYLVVGYVIYGGYLYMFSSGDTNKVTAGKKTLTHAFIGLAIVILANVIIGSIRVALLSSSGSFSNCIDSGGCANSDPAKLITNLISWVIGIAGLVSAVFIVVGGVGYVTSSGDSAKLQKAKNTITYALIGLAIVGLSEIIVSIVSGIINDSNKVSQTNQIIISKEYYEN